MWYENDYRRIFMDMHLNDSNEEYLSKLDPDSFVAALVDADVSSVVVKAKSHVGLHYWPSEYGRMHNTLKKRNLDYVGEMIKKCHDNHINVILYFSQMYDNYAYDHHRSWRERTQAGTASKFSVTKKKERYGIVCPNNKHYQQYCKEILTELATKYEFEGIFMDMPFWPRVCYCHSCRAKYFKETGHLLPPLIWRVNTEKWHRFQGLRENWIDEFMAGNTKALKDVNPNIAVEHNMAAVGLNWFSANVEKQFRNSDYASGDYYGGYLEQTFMCKYYNNMTVNKPFSYITSRCDNTLYNHTVTRTYQDLLVHDLNALVHGGAFSICDAMNPDGTITDKIYHNEIKQLFATTKCIEPYISGNLLCDVAIWYNTAYKVNNNFIKSSFNIAQIMLDNNIAFDVIGSKNLASTKAQVVCITDTQKISDEEVEILSQYVKNGGNLFVSGKLGDNKKFEELVGISISGMSAYWYTYLTPCGQSFEFEDFDKSSPYPVEQSAFESKIVADDMQVLATISYPYTLPTTSDFSAIHSNPPGIHTDLPAITKRKFGKGSIMWCATQLELTVAHNCKKTIARLISSMLVKREFISNAPSFVEIVKWTKGEKTYLSLVNQQTTAPIYPIDNIEIELDRVYSDIKIVSGTNSKLDISERNGKTIVKIATLDIFHVLEMK